MISDTFPHVQLLFFSSKRASGKWKVQRHLNQHFSPHAICLVACTIPKWISSTFQRLPGLHSLAGDLVRKAKQRVIGVSRLSQSEAASQSRISGAGQHSFSSSLLRKGFLPVKCLLPAPVCSDVSARILGLKSTDVKKPTQTRKQPSWVLFSISRKHYKSQSHSRYLLHVSLFSYLWAK